LPRLANRLRKDFSVTIFEAKTLFLVLIVSKYGTDDPQEHRLNLTA